MFGYATVLRSRTQGRAAYSMFFDRYEQAPRNVATKSWREGRGPNNAAEGAETHAWATRFEFV